MEAEVLVIAIVEVWGLSVKPVVVEAVNTVPVDVAVQVPEPILIVLVFALEILIVVPVTFPVAVVVPSLIMIPVPLKLANFKSPVEDIVSPVPPEIDCPVASRLPVTLTVTPDVNTRGPVVVRLPALTAKAV